MSFLTQDNPRLKVMRPLQDKLRAHAAQQPANYPSILFPVRSGKHSVTLRGNEQMDNQNPSEVHGPTRASNYRSHTSCLNVSLSPTQPALWVFHLLYTLFPFQLPQRSGHQHPNIPHSPGSVAAAPNRSAWEATGSRGSPGSPPSAASRASEGCSSHPISGGLGYHRGASPAWKGDRRHRRCRTPPQPLTSVSMGSTSIPFHSSSKWAIGMLGDSCLRTGSSRRSARRPPARAGAEKGRCRGERGTKPSGTGTLQPPARQNGSALPPGEPRAGRGRSAGAGGRTRQRPPLRSRRRRLAAPSRPCRPPRPPWLALELGKVAAEDAAAGAAMATAARTPPSPGPAPPAAPGPAGPGARAAPRPNCGWRGCGEISPFITTV